MGDIDDGNALLTKQFHNLEHILNFIRCQRSAGLIHDEDLCVLLDRLRDLDHLLIADRQILHQFPGIDLDLQLIESPGCFFFHGFSVDHDAVADRSSQKQVLRRRQFSDIVELLIDDRYAILRGQLRGHTVKLFPVDFDLSGCGNNCSRAAFDQGGLAGPVLSYQSEDLSFTQLQGYILQGNNAGVFFPDMFQFKDILFTHTLFAS